jgi:hypothetical protein
MTVIGTNVRQKYLIAWIPALACTRPLGRNDVKNM